MTRVFALPLARAALVWERSAIVLAGPFGAFGVYLTLALFGVFERTGDPWRLIALALALLTAALWIWRTARRPIWPNSTDVERRVEDDSGLHNRPFEALRDAPAAGDAAAWRAHQARMRDQLVHARARRPKSAWARLDPYGVRISLVLVVLTGAFLAGDLAGPRLGDAFAPRLLAGGASQAGIDLWIEPPEYTGRPTVFLRDRRAAEAPEGSVLAGRISGLRRDPSVSGAPAEIEALSEDVRLLRAQPQASGDIVIRAGALRERVSLTLIEDLPPRVALAAEPEGDAQGRLQLEFVAEDDYGLEAFVFEFALDTGASDEPVEQVLLAPGDVTAPDSGGLRTATIDLAQSRFAGERVIARMAALDGAGQRGVSGEIGLTLPQRIFLDPLARAVAFERRRFLSVEDAYEPMPAGPSAATSGGFLDDQPDRRIERAPAEVRRLARALDAVSDAPALYFDDVIVWTGLRTAMREVRRARELDDLAHLDADLWNIALRAELGSLADAEAALRAAEQALMDALARGADPIELSALFDAFEQAMANYMQALAREAAEAGRVAEGGGGPGMNADALQELLDALREAAELGDTAGSRRALAQLAELLRNLQLTLTQNGGGEAGESAMAEALREALEELSETIGEQRSVMEDTFEETRNAQDTGEPGAAGDPSDDAAALQDGGAPEPSDAGAGAEGETRGGDDFDALAERQEALENAVPGLLDSLPEAGAGEDGADALDEARDALGAAEDAMEEARRALESGDGDGALIAQDEALGALREASRAASEAVEAEQANGQEGEGSDPLGRNGSSLNGQTDLPSEADRQRARDILEELRRRAAERGRPQEELDYIDRLLERF